MERAIDVGQLGRFVCRLRKRERLSLRTLAERAEVDPTWIWRLERGEYASPDPRLLVRLADAFGIDVTDLFAEAGFATSGALPSLQPYLRTRYNLPEPAVREVSAFFDYINHRYCGEGEGNDVNHNDAS
jgi:transcriptional regulator with XRE-family HTH domain